MKDIVILADFCGPLNGTYNSRFLYLADMLKDCSVEVITSDFYHDEKRYLSGIEENKDYKITLLHEGAYYKNISLRRFLGHIVWGVNVKKYLAQRKKPDVIYAAVPPLSAPLFAASYCKKNNVRFVIDIQDLWPEAFKMVFNVPPVSSIAYCPFRWMADKVYRSADKICAVSESYAKRALTVNKKAIKSAVVFLGTNLKTFDKNASRKPCMEKPDGEIWLGYCGTLGSSYDITCVIDALKILNRRDVRFIVMGDGPRKKEFEEYADAQGVNAEFTGRLNYDSMCALLKQCDIAVNPITRGAAQSIINKHADYAAAGIPVINTQENEEYRNLVDSYNMGINCDNDNAEDFAEKLDYLLNNDDVRVSMGKNARRCAEEKFDRGHSYNLLKEAIEN